MLKKFTTTFYINLFHNINTAPFQIKKLKQTNQKKKKKKKEKTAMLH